MPRPWRKVSREGETYVSEDDGVDRATHAGLLVLVLEAAHALSDGRVLLGLDRGVPGVSCDYATEDGATHWKENL